MKLSRTTHPFISPFIFCKFQTDMSFSFLWLWSWSLYQAKFRECLWNTHTRTHTLTVCVRESVMWILTPPWLLFSLRGWRKRCQHDPGSRLWRGSGGKSKTLSISSPHIDVPLSQIFALCFLSRSLLRSETCAHRWFLFMRIYCLSRGNKDDRMLFFLLLSKSL